MLHPEDQSSLFEIFFLLNPTHFKLDSQQFAQPLDNRILQIDYEEYQEVERQILPQNIRLIAVEAKDETIIDTCGTGGDETNTFNVSTATALVVAGGGIKVAKHGQRAESNYCGSADVLEALGVKLDISRSDIERCMREVGIGFLYAPLFYRAMKYPLGPRREMGCLRACCRETKSGVLPPPWS